jgi:uncharacterized repeat protein (TIGR01451 family)
LDHHTVTPKITPIIPEYNLTITKVASTGVVIAGQQVTYTLHRSYSGNVALNTASVRDILPIGMTLDSSNPINNGLVQSTATTTGYAIYNLSPLSAGQSSGDIIILATLTGMSGSTITNTAKIGTISGTTITYTGETDT